jgi:hypothetical protein
MVLPLKARPVAVCVKELNMPIPLAFPIGAALGSGAGIYALKNTIDNSPKKKREAAAEIKRESRGVEKPANFDAMQEAKDAKDRKKISDMGYASGGKVSSASKRADGIATKGKTKGTMVKMNYGGKC